MSFTARTLGRAMGSTARIQPRIAPMTSPDSGDGEGSRGLEFVDVEIEARPDQRRSVQPNREREPASPTRPREPAVARDVEAASEPTHEDPRPFATHRDDAEAEPLAASLERPRGPAPSVSARLDVEHVEIREPLEPRERIEQPPRAPSRPSAPEPGRTSRPASTAEVPSFRARAQRLFEPLEPDARSIPRGVRAPEGLDEIDVEVESSPDTIDEPSSSSAAPNASARSQPARPQPARPQPARSPTAHSLDSDAHVRATDPPESDTSTWTPRRRQRDTGSSGPIVRVEIGRIELRAPPTREPPAQTSIPKPDTFVSLKQYLRDRGGS